MNLFSTKFLGITFASIAIAGIIFGADSAVGPEISSQFQKAYAGGPLQVSNTATATATAATTATLTIFKTVTESTSVTPAAPGDWTIDITGTAVPDMNNFAGDAAGTVVTLTPGTFSVSESGGPVGGGYVLDPLGGTGDCSGTVAV